MSYVVWALVGNSLGSNFPKKALKYVKTSMAFAFIFWLFTIALLLIFKKQFAVLFTHDPKIVELMHDLIPIYALIIICDYIQGVQGGIIRGMGYQHFASLIMIIWYWLVAIPIAYILAFKFDYRIKGVWLGLPAGSLLIWSSFTSILFITDWRKLANEVHQRKEINDK